MIVIITGASHTGKTILAQRMLEKYKYPYFSIDHLKMGLIRSGNTNFTPEDDDELVGYLWPIVREMIKTAIENVGPIAGWPPHQSIEESRDVIKKHNRKKALGPPPSAVGRAF